ncbi:hypothetical protein [Metabacillus sp. Hm71]|uniref:hypothetical protein n=1 Tax=Metabacillus sp. Hm71 TaxID=3450743 RepID=UPI003F4207CE
MQEAKAAFLKGYSGKLKLSEEFYAIGHLFYREIPVYRRFFTIYRRNSNFIGYFFDLSAKFQFYRLFFRFISEIPILSAIFSIYQRNSRFPF